MRERETRPVPPGMGPSTRLVWLPPAPAPTRVMATGAPLPYRALIDHILENLSRRIGVDELAAIARLNVFQLSRAFRREHATTPYRLVLEVRIQHATQMLREGATIAQTALHAGFADQSHFTRHFKRLTGMTPKHYADSAAWQRARDPGPALPWSTGPAIERSQSPVRSRAGRERSAPPVS